MLFLVSYSFHFLWLLTTLCTQLRLLFCSLHPRLTFTFCTYFAAAPRVNCRILITNGVSLTPTFHTLSRTPIYYLCTTVSLTLVNFFFCLLPPITTWSIIPSLLHLIYYSYHKSHNSANCRYRSLTADTASHCQLLAFLVFIAGLLFLLLLCDHFRVTFFTLLGLLHLFCFVAHYFKFSLHNRQQFHRYILPSSLCTIFVLTK